jgi:hypothetical protein
MDATCFYETSVDFQWTTLRYISEDRICMIGTLLEVDLYTSALNYLNICTPREIKQRLFAFNVRKCLASQSVRMGVKPT